MKTDGETVLQTDVVVVGGGLAGMAAADAARAEGAQVLILDAPPWAWPPTRPFPTAFLQVPPPPIAPRPTFPTPYASAGGSDCPGWRGASHPISDRGSRGCDIPGLSSRRKKTTILWRPKEAGAVFCGRTTRWKMTKTGGKTAGSGPWGKMGT